MQPGAHRNDDDRPSRVGLMRGILVIVTAVAVGAFVLSRGLDDTSVEAVAAEEDGATGTTSTDPATTTTLGDPLETTTTVGSDQTVEDAPEDDATTSTTTAPAAPAIRAPADVSVLVLNGAGTKGVAGRGSEVLQAAGYSVLAPKNATLLGPTVVLYTEGFEAEAQGVAEAFGLDPVAVVGAYDPSSPPIDDVRDAAVIVVIGEDGLVNV